MTDPIADLLTRIRNAQAVGKTEVVVPFSKMKLGIAEVLKKEGFVQQVARLERVPQVHNFDQLQIILKYKAPKKPAITEMKRVSTPGRRMYASAHELPVVLNNLGIAIVSTSQGLMTGKQARKAGLGGEIICE